jgi:hypothetical protein
LSSFKTITIHQILDKTDQLAATMPNLNEPSNSPRSKSILVRIRALAQTLSSTLISSNPIPFGTLEIQRG